MIIRENEKCPKCNGPVTVLCEYNEAKEFLGYHTHATYVLVADCIYHSDCWKSIEEEHKHLIGPSLPNDPEDQLLLDF